ncbi:MAG: hypothetical protein ACJ74Z_10980 [Bryobacteraceae bacterium]
MSRDRQSSPLRISTHHAHLHRWSGWNRDRKHGRAGSPSSIVIYDPSAGFVTGGGWINSPGGAYTPKPSLTGKATFGFVSKYQKRATVPTGDTEFQFQVTNFDFHSNTYQWMVVSGPMAQLCTLLSA